MEDAIGKRKVFFEHALIENENTFISLDLTQWTHFQQNFLSSFCARSNVGKVEHWKDAKTWSFGENKFEW